MKRNPQQLADGEFDLLVVGAGMFGACVAWCAALRGYSVALIDKGDFGHATSSNHFKFIHGGMRYLQHVDIPRLRESSRERSALIRIAPHLAYPMPIVLPTYGRGMKGKMILRAGMFAYDLLTPDRNRGIPDRARRTPMGRIIGRSEVIRNFPGVKKDGLTGAALFHDGQMYNPPRLVLAFVKSAVDRGVVAVNYVEATRFLVEGDRVTGCEVRDRLGGASYRVRGRVVVNAAGPWASRLLLDDPKLDFTPRPSFSRDLAFVVDRCISPSYSLGCQARSHDSDALLDRGARHLFLTPWRGKTLVGVWHRYSKASPERISVSREELRQFLAEVNSAYAGLDLSLGDIQTINTGLILFGSGDDQASSSDHSFAKRSVLVDHARHGLQGLISLVGARATVARGMGEKTLDLVERKLRVRKGKSASEWSTIHGGDFSDFDALTAELRGRLSKVSGDGQDTGSIATTVAHNYGSASRALLDSAPDESWLTPLGRSSVLKVEVLHAIREEMATCLADVVLRRTELGTGGHPGAETLDAAAGIAGQELGWDEPTRDAEVSKVSEVLANLGPWRIVNGNSEIPAGE